MSPPFLERAVRLAPGRANRFQITVSVLSSLRNYLDDRVKQREHGGHSTDAKGKVSVPLTLHHLHLQNHCN